MGRSFSLLVFCVFAVPLCAEESLSVGPADWPWWRGPTQNGIANPDQNPPTKWSEEDNVLWKVPVPGRAHGSPTVVADRIYLTAADEKRELQSVLCFDRETGKHLWNTVVHEGGLSKKGNKRASQASSSVACDGKRLFVNFNNRNAVHTTALDLDGKKLWQTKITDYIVHQGYGASPMVYRSTILVTADNKGGGAVAALDRATGKIVWKVDRPKTPNYVSPILANFDDKDHLLLCGCDLVTCLDPSTGKKRWETKGSTTECVTSIVTDGKVLITSGGYPRNHIDAVRVDGSGKVAWSKRTRVYVPSMILHEGYLYAVTDAGFAMCIHCTTGEVMWDRARLGGTFNASPVLVGKRIYAINEAGKAFIFEANPEKFELVAENTIPGEVFATPSICGSRIYMRIAKFDKRERQEYLYCIANKD